MTADNPSLETLRREIDAIDDAIHDLLLRRAGMVSQIAAAKAPGSPAIRAARESAVLRRLAARHHPPLPLAAVLRIWREIIGACTRLQTPLNLVAAGGEGADGRRDLARDHFGSTASVTLAGTAQAALARLRDGSAIAAILPWPEDNEAAPWWTMLAASDSHEAGPVRIIARLPAASSGADEHRALIVGRLPFDPSGEDHSLAVVELAEDLSRSRMRQALAAAGLELIDLWQAGDSGAPVLRLIEIAGFVPADDPRLRALADSLPGLHSIRPVGGFALPLVLDRASRSVG